MNARLIQTLIGFVLSLNLSFAAPIDCQELLLVKGPDAINAPRVDGFVPLGSQVLELEPNTYFFLTHYREPGTGPDSRFTIPDPTFLNHPFYRQYGYRFRDVSQSNSYSIGKNIEFRMPSVPALNAIGRKLGKINSDLKPGFTFVQSFLEPSPLEFAEHVAVGELPVQAFSAEQMAQFVEYRFDSFSDEEKLGLLFYHDRNLHVPFWVVVGVDLQQYISTKYAFLLELKTYLENQKHFELAKKIETGIAYEIKALDLFSAVLPRFLSKPQNFSGALKAIKMDPTKLFSYPKDGKSSDAETIAIAALHLLTRGAESHFNSYDLVLNYIKPEVFSDKYKVMDVFLDNELTAEQRADVREIYRKYVKEFPSPEELVEIANNISAKFDRVHIRLLE